jgi:phosphohistidine phosphatase
MRLILLRHAQAVAVGEDGVTTDFDRHLTARGRRQAAAVTAHLTNVGVVFDAILSSPFKRAVQTAEALAPLLRDPTGFAVAEELASESGRIEKMAAAIGATGGEWVAAVGHMPDIAALCRALGGHDVGAFDTAQAVCLRFDGSVALGGGRLEWVFAPTV